MTMIRSSAAVALACVVWTAPPPGPIGASAQDPGPKGNPAVPEPARCAAAVEPRPVADLEGLLEASDEIGVTIGAASPEAAEPEAAEPADAEATAAAAETIELLYACYNANDYPRAFALFTDAGLERVLPGFALTDKDLAYMAESPEPAPAPKETWRAIAVDPVVALPDGRLRASVDGVAADGAFAAVALLVEAEDGLRIDDLATTPSGPVETERKETS